MKYLFFTLILTSSISVFSQSNSDTDDAEVYKRINNYYLQKDFAKALDLAEELVTAKEKQSDLNVRVKAVSNLGLLQVEYFRYLKNQTVNSEQNKKENPELSVKMSKTAEKAEKYLRQSVKIYEKDLEIKNRQLATVKNELAWLLYNYFPPPPPKVTQLKHATFDNTRLRIEEAEKLYIETLSLLEQISGKGDDATLFTVFDFAEFYQMRANFEKAIPLYQKFITSVENKYGKTHASLIPALRRYADILVTIDGDDISKIVQRISAITGDESFNPEPSYDLTYRVKKFGAQQNLDFSLMTSANYMGSMTVNGVNVPLRGILSGGDKFLDSITKNKIIPVKVLIDEKGKVIEAVAETSDKKLKAEAEKSVVEWTVKPFELDSKASKMRGWLIYYAK